MANVTITPSPGAPCTVKLTGAQILGTDNKPTDSFALDGAGAGTCKVVLGDKEPPAAIGPGYNELVLASLCILLALVTAIGVAIVYGMIKDLDKTLDKLAQLLSEENPPKMSLSRVQALIFTYVLAFGSLLIIVRTGQFPSDIPNGLAILAGGSLATYVISKAIQKTT
jgi:nitrate/nitrite transporter NarK